MRKIDRRLSKPKVPLRKVSHEERIEIGRKISSQILDSYKDAVLAICIYGSVAKRLDRPYSDLEIFCVVTDNLELTSKFYVYDGLLVEIDYFQESKFLGEAAKKGRDWHLGADQFGNDRMDFTQELQNATIGMTESLAAILNAHLKSDQRDLRTRAFYMAWDTARVVFLYNRKFVLTTSWFWKQLFECQKQPKRFRKLVNVVAGFEKSTSSELVDAAEQLWRETMLMVQQHGISIESTDVIV